MKRVTVNITIVSMVVYVLALTCFITLFSDDKGEINVAATSPANQYFEGNLSYTANGTFFEESVSGAIIRVDTASISYIIESKLPQISKRKGMPVHVELSGYLTAQPDGKEKSENYLTVNKIKKVYTSKCRIEPMVGTYEGGGQKLAIFPDHTYTLQDKNGNEKRGDWFLNSKNIMILWSEKSKTVMRINYKKKSLNSRDDNPTIFMRSSNLSNH